MAGTQHACPCTSDTPVGAYMHVGSLLPRPITLWHYGGTGSTPDTACAMHAFAYGLAAATRDRTEQ
eukprot:9274855-Lingulodinium_polyedra.AAC.1